MQKSTVLKNDFECIFDRFEVLVVIIWFSRLLKTPNTCTFANAGRFFTHFLKSHILRFLKDF